MTECYCAKCADEPAQTYTERHRHVTECKWVAKRFYSDVNGFERHMQGVAKERGSAGALKLRDGVNYLWGLIK